MNYGHSGYDEGVRELMLQLIAQAAKDSMMLVKTLPTDFRNSASCNRTQRAAIKWLKSEDCMQYCSVLEIDHECLIEKVGEKRQDECCW